MKYLKLSLIALVGFTSMAHAQKVYTKNGSVSFFSKTPMENIDAHNNQVMAVFNVPTGELQFSLLVKGFHFQKALMEEHFNENYLESEKFPKSTFKGKITDLSKVNFEKDGVYPVTVTGDLTMHGVTKSETTKGTITVKGGNISSDSKFIVKLADYKVEIPKLVKENISETIEITVACKYDQKM
ncbi:MAG: YceI family protein [Ferruginibacter sp.]